MPSPTLRLVALPLALLVLLVACGSAGPSAPPATSPSSTSSASGAPGSVAPSVEASPLPGSPTASGGAPALGQTETEFGTIWDGVPEGFPRFRGGRDADDAGPEPASDVYVIPGGDAALITEWLQSAMEDATYSTQALSGPFEDGGYELVSVGAGECRIRTTITPTGDLILVTVLYGAACPAG